MFVMVDIKRTVTIYLCFLCGIFFACVSFIYIYGIVVIIFYFSSKKGYAFFNIVFLGVCIEYVEQEHLCGFVFNFILSSI